MAWDFETDPEFQDKLDWMDEFVRDEIEPLRFVLGSPYDLSCPNRQKLIPPLQEEVKKDSSGPATWDPTSAARVTARSSWR